jgi:hypothetical protein
LLEIKTGTEILCFCGTTALQLQQTINGLQILIPQSLLVGQVLSEQSCFLQQDCSVQVSGSEVKKRRREGDAVKNKMYIVIIVVNAFIITVNVSIFYQLILDFSIF